MADRKSSENELLTELANNDLFDVLDADEGVLSNKNKSITKQSLFNQIANELSLAGDPALTTLTSGFNSGYSGTFRFYKMSKFVFFNANINVSGPSFGIVRSAIDSALRPVSSVYIRSVTTTGSSDSRMEINSSGIISLYRDATISSVVASGVYSASGFYMTN